MTWTATMSSKGQLTIPRPLRETLRLEAGVQVLLALRDGKIEIQPISGDIQRWRGALKEAGPTPLEEVEARTRQAIAEEVVREMQGH